MKNTSSRFTDYSEFATFILTVATHLSIDGSVLWSYQADNQGPCEQMNATLKRADGLTLDVDTNGYRTKGKIVVSYSRPHNKANAYVEVYENNERVSNPSMGCADSKTAEQVAADIARRLLPDAERVHTLVQARIAEQDDYKTRHNAALLAVSQAAGLPDVPRDHHSKEPRFALYIDRPNKAENDYSTLAHVEVRGPDCTHFTLDATDAHAVPARAEPRSEPHVIAPEQTDARALARFGIVYESKGFYIRETKTAFQVYRPAKSGTHAEHCGERAKTEPDALAKCKRTVDRLARYAAAV